VNRDTVYEQLKIDEGVVYKIYLDHLDLPTFGIGHLILKSDKEYGMPVGTKISEDRVKSCFNNDLDIAIEECNKLYKKFNSFPEIVQEVLVNMMFNMGRPRLSGFIDFKAALDVGNWKEAAKEGRDSKWYKQVPTRAERLMCVLEKVS